MLFMVKKSDKFQRRIGKKLGVNVGEDTWRIAAAKIKDYILPAIAEPTKRKCFKKATERQRIFASELGLRGKNCSKGVISAKIKDRLEEINGKALRKLKLKNGDKVYLKNNKQQYVVSSVGSNGRIYFKGGCMGAWPSQIYKIK